MKITRRPKGFSEAETRFQALKLKALDRPLDDEGQVLEPTLPKDLTQIEDNALGWLYGNFAVMVQYSAAHLSRAETEAATAKRALRIRAAEAAIAYKGPRGLMKAFLTLEPSLRALEDQIATSEALAGLLKGLHSSYLIGHQSCSREMTRRSVATERKLRLVYSQG